MITKTPKRFEDITFSELIENRRNKARSLAGMERVLKVPSSTYIPNRDKFSAHNAARGPRPDTFYKQQRKNLNNGVVKIDNSYDSEGTY